MTDRAASLTLEQYAALLVRLPEEPPERARVLAEHGLDEQSWEELDQRYQAELDAAMQVGEGANVPALLSRFSAALGDGVSALEAPPLELEPYARFTRGLQLGRDPQKLVEAEGVSMRVYMDAHLYWTPRLARDPGLSERFRHLLEGREGSKRPT